MKKITLALVLVLTTPTFADDQIDEAKVLIAIEETFTALNSNGLIDQVNYAPIQMSTFFRMHASHYAMNGVGLGMAFEWCFSRLHEVEPNTPEEDDKLLEDQKIMIALFWRWYSESLGEEPDLTEIAED